MTREMAEALREHVRDIIAIHECTPSTPLEAIQKPCSRAGMRWRKTVATTIYPRKKPGLPSVGPTPSSSLQTCQTMEIDMAIDIENYQTADWLDNAETALARLSKADAFELRQHRGQVTKIHNLAIQVWNDAWAPALATRFDDEA